MGYVEIFWRVGFSGTVSVDSIHLWYTRRQLKLQAEVEKCSVATKARSDCEDQCATLLKVGRCVSPNGLWVCLPSWLVGVSPLMVGGCVSPHGWWVGLSA